MTNPADKTTEQKPTTQEVQNVAVVPPQPWEKQVGESDAAFSAFVVYRDMPQGHRSHKGVASILYPTSPKWASRKVSEWSTKFHWESRVSAWLSEVDRVRRESQLETVKSMGQRHSHLAKMMLDKAEQALNNLTPANLTDPAVLLRFISEAAKMERQSRALIAGKELSDDDDDKPERTDKLSTVSDDELKRLAEVAEKHQIGTGEETPH